MQIARNPDSVPLAERFQIAQYLRRELSEHLRQAFLPKFSDLRHASKVADVSEVTDQEMFDKMTAAIQADEFAAQLFGKLFRYLDSIERETRTLLKVRDGDDEDEETDDELVDEEDEDDDD